MSPLFKVGSIIMLAVMQAAFALEVGNLKMQACRNPIGIDVATPYFGWILASDERGVVQESYEIRVATDRDFQNVVWQSGKVSSSQSVDVLAQGFTTSPRTRYYWQVTVRGGKYDGTVSDIFRFTTADAKAHFPTPVDGDAKAQLREIKGETSPCAPLTLRWRDGFSAKGYNVVFADNENLDNAVTATVTSPAFQPEGLRHGKQYFWRVDAVNGDGQTVTGDLWTFKSPVSHARTGRNEVEHAVRGALCFPERDNTPGWIVASNDSCNVGDQGPGYMSFVWAGERGVYSLTTAYFDESSGQGVFSIYVNETRKDQWTASKNKNTMELRHTDGVSLEPGDELRLEFYTQKNMRCRTDYIDIVQTSTGIQEIPASDTASDDADAPVYSMTGQRVSPSARGIVIINGRKTVR